MHLHTHIRPSNLMIKQSDQNTILKGKERESITHTVPNV